MSRSALIATPPPRPQALTGGKLASHDRLSASDIQNCRPPHPREPAIHPQKTGVAQLCPQNAPRSPNWHRIPEIRRPARRHRRSLGPPYRPLLDVPRQNSSRVLNAIAVVDCNGTRAFSQRPVDNWVAPETLCSSPRRTRSLRCVENACKQGTTYNPDHRCCMPESVTSKYDVITVQHAVATRCGHAREGSKLITDCCAGQRKRPGRTRPFPRVFGGSRLTHRAQNSPSI